MRSISLARSALCAWATYSSRHKQAQARVMAYNAYIAARHGYFLLPYAAPRTRSRRRALRRAFSACRRSIDLAHLRDTLLHAAWREGARAINRAGAQTHLAPIFIGMPSKRATHGRQDARRAAAWKNHRAGSIMNAERHNIIDQHRQAAGRHISETDGDSISSISRAKNAGCASKISGMRHKHIWHNRAARASSVVAKIE